MHAILNQISSLNNDYTVHSSNQPQTEVAQSVPSNLILNSLPGPVQGHDRLESVE